MTLRQSDEFAGTGPAPSPPTGRGARGSRRRARGPRSTGSHAAGRQRAGAEAAAAEPFERYADLCAGARSQLHDGRAAEAVATARAALEILPRGLEGQRLLGLGLLATGDVRGAVSALQSGLACEPVDLVAQVGLAEAQEMLGGPDAAEPDWQRAWELQPGHPAVAERVLAARRAAGALEGDGSLPGLTRAALARIHFRGGLYEHAAAEARWVLDHDPSRTDIHLLLAEACWRLGDGEGAAAVASAILDRSPDCVAANWLVAAEWRASGRDAGPLLARIQAVDPAGIVAARLFDDREVPALFDMDEGAAEWMPPDPTVESVPEAVTDQVPEPALAARSAEPGAVVDTAPPGQPDDGPRLAQSDSRPEPVAETPVQRVQEPPVTVPEAAQPPGPDQPTTQGLPVPRPAAERDDVLVDDVVELVAYPAPPDEASAPPGLVRLDWIGGPVAAAVGPAQGEPEVIGAAPQVDAMTVPAPDVPAAPAEAEPASAEPRTPELALGLAADESQQSGSVSVDLSRIPALEVAPAEEPARAAPEQAGAEESPPDTATITPPGTVSAPEGVVAESVMPGGVAAGAAPEEQVERETAAGSGGPVELFALDEAPPPMGPEGAPAPVHVATGSISGAADAEADSAQQGEDAHRAGDRAMREGRYLDAVYAYGEALRALRSANRS